MASIWTKQGSILALHRLFTESPTYSAPSLIEIGTGTTAPTVSDTSLQTPVELTSGVYFANFSAGYPVIDETNLQVTIRGFINSLQANGNNLSEFGIFNSDGTKKMVSRCTFTPITKTDQIEISFVEKDKL